MQSSDDQLSDEVVKRMLATPPQPKSTWKKAKPKGSA